MSVTQMTDPRISDSALAVWLGPVYFKGKKIVLRHLGTWSEKTPTALLFEANGKNRTAAAFMS